MQYLRAKYHAILAVLLLPVISSPLIGGEIRLVDAFPNISFFKPIFLTHPGDGTNRLFVVQQTGLIMVFNNDPATASVSTFLDVSGKLSAKGGEEGLLGLAFHPQFATNGVFFINYTAPNPLRTVVAKYHVSAANPSVADTAGEVVLEVNQPYTNHNGGMLAFGPDGYLYIGMGDGGSGGDPQNNGQSLTTLLGKILRIDVNSQSQNYKYVIPPDNPFVGNFNGYREEIWAYGLRNPWRFSFDRTTGLLWAGDVGQSDWEEVDIIERGKNYGWRIMEGFSCYEPHTGCDKTGLTLPVVSYSHTEGQAITGGYVYRGSLCPDLVGTYLYGDYGTRRVWRLKTEAGSVISDSLLFLAPSLISSFGEDNSGELYVTSYSSTTSTQIYRFDQTTPTWVQEGGLHPEGFHLEQNFPNPFNPATSIRFTVGVVSGQSPAPRSTAGPVTSNVRMAVYDLLGREVAMLVDGEKEPGTYEVSFDGSNLPSGVYIYKLIAGGYTECRRMVLIK
jgi:glucose/arabinose dehydrogenase